MLFCVPAAKSSPAFPATVTVPDLLACLYCRWLPLVRTRCQPSFSRILISSLIFILNAFSKNTSCKISIHIIVQKVTAHISRLFHSPIALTWKMISANTSFTVYPGSSCPVEFEHCYQRNLYSNSSTWRCSWNSLSCNFTPDLFSQSGNSSTPSSRAAFWSKVYRRCACDLSAAHRIIKSENPETPERYRDAARITSFPASTTRLSVVASCSNTIAIRSREHW